MSPFARPLLLLACAPFLGVPNALAQSPGEQAAGASGSSTLADEQESAPGGTLSRLAAAVGRLPVSESALIALGAVEAQHLTASARKALHDRIGLIVGSAVPEIGRRLSAPTTRQDARALARRTDLPLVYLAPRLDGGTLVLEAQVIQWPRSFWQRALSPEGAVIFEETFSEPADSEIRRLLPRPARLLSQLKRFDNPVASPLAIACRTAKTTTVKSDATQSESTSPKLAPKDAKLSNKGHVNVEEFVIVGRRRIAALEFDGEKLTSKARRSWSKFSPISPHPLRSPLATAEPEGTGWRIGSSDRAYSLRLDASLSLLGVAPRTAPMGDGQCAAFSPTGVSTKLQPCPKVASSLPVTSQTPREVHSRVAYSQAVVTDERGTTTTVAVDLPTDGGPGLVVTRSAIDGSKRVSLPDLGTAFSTADIDGDGHAELIASKATDDAKKDALLVYRLVDGRLSKTEELAVGPVHALTVCPFSGKNPQTVAIAVGKEIWIIP